MWHCAIAHPPLAATRLQLPVGDKQYIGAFPGRASPGRFEGLNGKGRNMGEI